MKMQTNLFLKAIIFLEFTAIRYSQKSKRLQWKVTPWEPNSLKYRFSHFL
jgi:hypothetical protein